ncbi:PspA/IM30 family protein [Polyangium jinanense]|uniref:PspA/IM30 family protein n=1 Tax=Polyangium jinanense TaxID=2829994 RepID=A0A9X4ASQ7_9BACT|nr:PspA/IM30 family protein [Polyangium jinanense]MDC3954787.1 PspA/IM30 family protein [Polyangium jinanense]MDC3981442.1 PspA/IM30 family protein [Polyangium jinanense]
MVLLNRFIIQAAEALIEAKKDTAVAIADEKRLFKQIEQEVEAAKEWEQRARKASEAGDDVLAKEALARQQAHAGFVSQLRADWQEQREIVEELKGTLRRFNHAIEQAKFAKNRLIARKLVTRTRLLEEQAARMDRFVEMLDLLVEFEGTRQRGGPGQRRNSVP